MDLRLRLPLALALAAAFTALGCVQQEGEVCDVDPECAEGLVCCGRPHICAGATTPARRGRGLCTPSAECDPEEVPICLDAGGVDGGAVDGSVDGSVDAGDDAGAMDAGPEDAGQDSGPMDAGSDAGSPDAGSDAGSSDAGAADAGDAG
jgi:hypothetical protein